MKLLIVGDTHLPKKSKSLPQKLLEARKEADKVIHTGDWQTREVYEEFQRGCPLYGVYGNVDDEYLQTALPGSFVWKEEGYSIGLVHGHEGTGSSTEKRVVNFFEEPLDLVLFGHSHIPYLRYHGKTLFVNPGSAVDKRRAPYHSFAWVELTSRGIEVKYEFY